jgi:hypothetical protein
MAVFICCADESSDARQQEQFFYGGFAAPVDAWESQFIPAWNERVLAGPPVLEYLHMSDLMCDERRQASGLTWWDADERITEASRVIGSTGALIPIVWSFSYQQFAKEMLPYAPWKKHTGLEEPDYLTFLCFVHSTLQWLYEHRHDEAQRVDFWVEHNGKITTRIGRFHERIPENLIELGRPELAAMCGEFTPVSKTRIQAQAADMLCWHERNACAGRLDIAGQRRHARIVGNKAIYGCGREGCRNDVGDVMFPELAEMLAQKFRIRRVK